jgi:SAM-dependent methyltransferase
MAEESRDFLKAYLAEAPLALAILRAVECRELAECELDPPILDLGCGDGLTARILWGESADWIDAGLDLSLSGLLAAKGRGMYRCLTCADLTHIPFADHVFGAVLSNCVLEHVPDLAAGLREIARVLKPGGRLVFTVPTARCAQQLTGAALLRGLRLQGLAQRYAAAYDRRFGQVHLYDVPAWKGLLAQSGLRLVESRRYASESLLRLHDLLMPLCLPGRWIQGLTGKRPRPGRWRRRVIAPLMALLLRRAYKSARNGCSLLMVAEIVR